MPDYYNAGKHTQRQREGYKKTGVYFYGFLFTLGLPNFILKPEKENSKHYRI